MDHDGAAVGEVAANRELWTRANREYDDDHARRAWAAERITWGIFNVPEEDLGHGEWITILCASGFTIDGLREVYAPPDAPDRPYYQLATTEWARQWPVEEIWTAYLTQ